MMETAKPEQTAVNGPGTGSAPDTQLTRGRSGPVHFEIVNLFGQRIGPFHRLADLLTYVSKNYPDQEQDPDRTGKGWDVQVVA